MISVCHYCHQHHHQSHAPASPGLPRLGDRRPYSGHIMDSLLSYIDIDLSWIGNNSRVVVWMDGDAGYVNGGGVGVELGLRVEWVGCVF